MFRLMSLVPGYWHCRLIWELCEFSLHGFFLVCEWCFMLMSPGEKTQGALGCGVCSPSPGVQLEQGAAALLTAQGTAAIRLDLQDKPATNSNPISLSTAGLGTVSLDLCRSNFWGRQIWFLWKSSLLCILMFTYCWRVFKVAFQF